MQERKDHGHYARKAVWLALGVVLIVPHIIFDLGSKADEWIMNTGSRMHRWSHPDLYAPRPSRRR